MLKSIKNRKEYTNKEKQEIKENEDNIDLLKQKKRKIDTTNICSGRTNKPTTHGKK